NFTNNQDGNVGLTKTGDAAAAPVAGDPTRYTISYTVTATNGAFVPKPLTVEDEFKFPASITIVPGTLAVTGSPSAADWDGSAAHPVLFTGTIDPQGTLQWTITLDVLVDPDASTADRTCDAPTNGGR